MWCLIRKVRVMCSLFCVISESTPIISWLLLSFICCFSWCMIFFLFVLFVFALVVGFGVVDMGFFMFFVEIDMYHLIYTLFCTSVGV